MRIERETTVVHVRFADTGRTWPRHSIQIKVTVAVHVEGGYAVRLSRGRKDICRSLVGEIAYTGGERLVILVHIIVYRVTGRGICSSPCGAVKQIKMKISKT